MTDAELIERLKAYDDDAYREAIARYGDALYRYVYSLTGDPHLCEDVVAETYLKLIESIGAYTYYGAPFKAWLYRIAHNLAVNALKRARRTVGVEDMDRVARPITDPAIRIVDRLEAAEVRSALEQLTEEQRQVLLLRFAAGQSPREVAQVLEKSENAVKQLQWRALRALERLLPPRD
ncbi:MAG TPA: RNA polymerase sigma factor [Roseiflexaceae bacterium]|nr:RNA polymerase sigma factor [Roseiflexaceae bacterium]